jgi:uncharacterized damage-inducible protein DinB
MRPEKGSYPVYFDNFIPLVKEDNVLDALENTGHSALKYLNSIAETKADYAYAEGKWTVKQLLCHIIDTERILSYRALSFARLEKQVLPGFDENSYVAAAELEHLQLQDLIRDFKVLREGTISMFSNFTETELLRSGAAASGPTTVLALGFMVCGHMTHHLNVLKQRYICD